MKELCTRCWRGELLGCSGIIWSPSVVSVRRNHSREDSVLPQSLANTPARCLGALLEAPPVLTQRGPRQRGPRLTINGKTESQRQVGGSPGLPGTVGLLLATGPATGSLYSHRIVSHHLATADVPHLPDAPLGVRLSRSDFRRR